MDIRNFKFSVEYYYYFIGDFYTFKYQYNEAMACGFIFSGCDCEFIKFYAVFLLWKKSERNGIFNHEFFDICIWSGKLYHALGIGNGANGKKEMKTEILQILRTTEDYVSGQELCDRLGVSRTAVWKTINKLKEEGYEIEAIQNKGYHLLSYPDIVTESEIKSRLEAEWAGNSIVYAEVVDSTNNLAKRLGEEGKAHGTLAIAEKQTAGKGRRGRSWSAPPRLGVWMSLLLRPNLKPSCASMLTLVSGLSVTRAIEEVTGLKMQIKWPNDIVYEGKKICGILTEMSAEMEGIHYVVVGIGINVNIEEFPEELKQKATSLKIICGKKIDRVAIVTAFLKYFESDYSKFLKTEDLELLKMDYEYRLVNLNQKVNILDGKKEYTGTAIGIEKDGGLLVEKEDKNVVAVTSGEVSVRGVYGYV